jgi:alpha-tubulin suppressor-like RCC1 family protein
MRCIVDSFRATVRARTSLWALLALPLLLLLGCQHGETPTEARGVPSYSEHSSSDHRFVSASAGVFHTCGVTAGSRAFCWGRNDQGQLGDGTTSQRLTPVAVSGDHRFASVSAGGPHTCGITANGQAFCWGRNQKGELPGPSLWEPPVRHRQRGRGVRERWTGWSGNSDLRHHRRRPGVLLGR